MYTGKAGRWAAMPDHVPDSWILFIIPINATGNLFRALGTVPGRPEDLRKLRIPCAIIFCFSINMQRLVVP
jgi:hypothetical protein